MKVIFNHVLSNSQQNIALLEGSQAAPACRSDKELCQGEEMNIEHDRVILYEVLCEKPAQVHFVHRESHTEWARIEPARPR